ncbi:MAG: peptidase domain-containing ABC transporter, partial [Muribaculaceae bacterium]|nr:peptidase domain-containing ABC transporter [Muribaculaceae bacterium]
MAFPFVKQLDSMQCGIACMAMICRHHGKKIPIRVLEKHCRPSKEGVSLKGIADLCNVLRLDYTAGRVSIADLLTCPMPCILHWNQNHFVVLYRIDRKGKRFWIADPGKGKYRLSLEEFSDHWLSTRSGEVEKGIAMFIEKTSEFDKLTMTDLDSRRSFRFLWEYVRQYRRYFFQIIAGLGVGCLLQLIMPFLTQWIVDIGIRHQDIKFIWLVLLGELMIVVGRTATDFIRRWLLVHISMRINISIVSDFFIKLLRLPMSFFETKLLGDLLQRMGDHSRIQSFLTNQVLGILFTFISFFIFGIILLIYDKQVFCIFLGGSIIYGLWIITFLNRRKVLDYQLFEQQAISQNRTYQFITNIPEIKLQDCERRRRWEWEDSQADLFNVQMKSVKLQQTQEAGSIFINEIKNILITVFAATGVISGDLTLGAMLAIQYIVGQLNSPVEQLMQFVYSL